ncbi:MAG: hypothetical protein JW797_13085 [Bradymonadales bacterium]|nr:hypothetical protein [Bradymonadales bacterium]
MLLSEIFAENLPGQESSLRLHPTPGFNRFPLPSDFIPLLRAIIRGLLFPQSASLEEVAATGKADQLQCGLMFQVGGRTVQVRRGLLPDSVVMYLLTEEGVLQSLAHGARSVESTLPELSGIRHLRMLDLLHLAYCPQPPVEGRAGQGEKSAPSARAVAGVGVAPPVAPDRAAFPPLARPPAQPAEKAASVDPLAFGMVSLPVEPSESGKETGAAPDALVDPLAFGLRDPLREDSPPKESAGVPLDSSPSTTDHLPGGAMGEGQIEQLRQEYFRVRQIEQLDGKIKGIEARLAQAALSLKDLTLSDQEIQKVKDQLANLPETDQIGRQEQERLRDEPARRQQLSKRRDALTTRMAAIQAESPSPPSLARTPVFLLGMAATLICTLLSILGGIRLRPVALGNLVGLTGALFGFLQFLRDRAAHQKVSARLDLLKNQLSELDTEQHGLESELAEIRRRAGVKTTEELFEVAQKRASLVQLQQQLLQRFEEQRSHPEIQKLDEIRIRLESELDALLRERGGLGECPLSCEQIAQELAYHNIRISDLQQGVPAATASAPRAPPSSAVPSLVDLYRLVEEFGLTSRRELEDDVAGLWGRIASKLFNRPISAPRFLEGGAIQIGGQPPIHWPDLTEQEQIICRESLNLAVLVRSVGRINPSPPPIVLRFSPFEAIEGEPAQSLLEFYQKLSKHMQITIFG